MGKKKDKNPIWVSIAHFCQPLVSTRALGVVVYVFLSKIPNLRPCVCHLAVIFPFHRLYTITTITINYNYGTRGHYTLIL